MENNMLLDEEELLENYIDDDEEINSYSEISYEIYTKYKAIPYLEKSSSYLDNQIK